MKKYITLYDITIDNEKTLKMKVIPRGTILTETYGGAVYESKKPIMCIGINWVKNNPKIFKEIK